MIIKMKIGKIVQKNIYHCEDCPFHHKIGLFGYCEKYHKLLTYNDIKIDFPTFCHLGLCGEVEIFRTY